MSTQTQTTANTTANLPPPPADMSSVVSQPVPPAASAGPAAAPSAVLPPPASSTSAAKPTKYYLGGREFNSAEELASYASTLQSKADLADRIQTQMSPAQPQRDEYAELADLQFTNPEEWNKKLEERVTAKAAKIYENQLKSQEVKTKFYADYSDLVGHEDIVGMKYNQMQNELAKMPDDQATLALANAVRAKIASIKGQATGTEVLPNGQARVVGSGAPAPTITTPAPVQKTFQDQVRDLQRKKTKTA